MGGFIYLSNHIQHPINIYWKPIRTITISNIKQTAHNNLWNFRFHFHFMRSIQFPLRLLLRLNRYLFTTYHMHAAHMKSLALIERNETENRWIIRCGCSWGGCNEHKTRFICYFRLNHTQQMLRSIFSFLFLYYSNAELILRLDIQRLDLSPLNILTIFAADIEYFNDILRCYGIKSNIFSTY